MLKYLFLLFPIFGFSQTNPMITIEELDSLVTIDLSKLTPSLDTIYGTVYFTLEEPRCTIKTKGFMVEKSYKHPRLVVVTEVKYYAIDTIYEVESQPYTPNVERKVNNIDVTKQTSLFVPKNN